MFLSNLVKFSLSSTFKLIYLLALFGTIDTIIGIRALGYLQFIRMPYGYCVVRSFSSKICP